MLAMFYIQYIVYIVCVNDLYISFVDVILIFVDKDYRTSGQIPHTFHELHLLHCTKKLKMIVYQLKCVC